MSTLERLPQLEVRGVGKRFGGVTALDDVTLDVSTGEAVAVIGPNGAGKSTLLKVITGQYRPDTGQVRLAGHDLRRRAPHQISRSGVALAHQVPRPFKGLTVRENVAVASMAGRHRGSAVPGAVQTVLERCQLDGKADVSAGDLRVLDLKRLELARALATEPSVLMLDEVAAGLVGRELDQIIELVRGIRDAGTSLLIVEHVEGVVESLVERVIVLNWGRVLAEGTPAEISGNAEVREVYLGAGSAPVLRAARILDESAPELLRLDGVSVTYGGVTALRDLSLEIGTGEVVAALGANGAGKSTLAGVISGLVPTAAGTVEFDQQDVTTLPSHRRARLGLAHCLEGRRVFVDLSVDENLRLAVPLGTSAADIAERVSSVHEIFPELIALSGRPSGALSGGQQQMLAIGRALMSRPRLLICDEISLGLAPVAIDALYLALERVRDSGVAILLIEQSVQRALDLADRALVLWRGTPTYLGPPGPLHDASALDRAYFGERSLAPTAS